ncbi:meiotic nuclear division protein 1 [Tricharina praecox]|uniref:meiotic nuclear division protein 1 n=1 Tax=Tricharina praecox TaxID=43433 RepID=UPI0022203BF4|nr:meiotic nuclear division protein 1 [Tricharina praecox]KAI5849931.1 meiotic nuclear division protein 1 [Tricharina praecox]
MGQSKDLPNGKLQLVLSYFRTTRVAHTLKDLEKSLPPAAGISGMLVKEYIAALVAESLISVEKIGSGNWYWSFPADAVRQKLNLLAEATKERDKARAALENVQAMMQEEKERIAGGEGGGDRLELVDRLREAEDRREAAREELKEIRSTKGAEVALSEKEKLRLSVNEMIDNIYALEKLLKDSGKEQEVIDKIRQTLGIEEELDYMD